MKSEALLLAGRAPVALGGNCGDLGCDMAHPITRSPKVSRAMRKVNDEDEAELLEGPYVEINGYVKLASWSVRAR